MPALSLNQLRRSTKLRNYNVFALVFPVGQLRYPLRKSPRTEVAVTSVSRSIFFTMRRGLLTVNLI